MFKINLLILLKQIKESVYTCKCKLELQHNLFSSDIYLTGF